MWVCSSKKMSQPKCLNRRILIIIHPVMEYLEFFDTTQLLKTSKEHGKCLQKIKTRIPLQFAEDYIYRKHVSI